MLRLFPNKEKSCFIYILIAIHRVRPKLACLREAAPLLELDRDERKLDAFLQLHKSDLLVADLRIFLPFTINLDPYLRKVLKGLYFHYHPYLLWRRGCMYTILNRLKV